uniref:Homing endonuclease n=1 Tax=viral metagenome TaxID=1070528 RepID=A0A6M3JY77_9ZZZZ
MDNQQAKLEKQLGWLGGILDGEGSFLLLKQNARWNTKEGLHSGVFIRPAIKLCNTNIDGIHDVIKVLDAVGLAYHVSWRKGTKNWKTSWMVEIIGVKRCLRACTLLEKYIVWKKGELKALKDYCASRIEGELNSREGFNSHKRIPKYSDVEIECVRLLTGRRTGTRLL